MTIGHFRSLTFLISAVLCAGCSSIQTKTPDGEPILMSESEFATYFERVFRHHNTVVNESMYTLALTPNTEDPVIKAEITMNHACQPLNEAASAAAAGETMDFWQNMALLDAVPECEAATRKLEKLLSIDKKP
jgi:hypothetical protein